MRSAVDFLVAEHCILLLSLQILVKNMWSVSHPSVRTRHIYMPYHSLCPSPRNGEGGRRRRTDEEIYM